MRRNIERLIEMLAAIPGARSHAHHQRLAAGRRKARALKDAGLQARHGEPGFARRRRSSWRMNDVDFPVAKVLDGIDAAAAAGLAPVKINMVVKRGVNEHSDPADGAPLQGQRATSCASSNSWTSARPTAGAWTTWLPSREIVAHDRRARCRSNRSIRITAAKSPSAGATATARARSASSPRSPRRSAATARARASPPKACSTPACSRPRATTLAPLLRDGASDDGNPRCDRRGVERARRPLLGNPHRGNGESSAKSRCRTSAADDGACKLAPRRLP